MEIRKFLRGDRDAISRILLDAGVFTEEEIACAMEMVQEPGRSDIPPEYESFCAVEKETGQILGFVCIGEAALAEGVYELYWIAVRPSAQRKGVASALLKFVEEYVAKDKCRMIVIETSSCGRYEPSRAFYRKHGYRQVAQVSDFYSVGDDKLIFTKKIRQS
jgi:ribosomal protein S18 acetylase RimI-like enzyme